jgi:hypothetical protein
MQDTSGEKQHKGLALSDHASDKSVYFSNNPVLCLTRWGWNCRFCLCLDYFSKIWHGVGEEADNQHTKAKYLI